MEYLSTPWRYDYVTGADKSAGRGVPPTLAKHPDAHLDSWVPKGENVCVFCNMISAVDHAIAHGMAADLAETAGWIVYRGKQCFICLNAFPYNSGHVMIVPFTHTASLAALDPAVAQEMMQLAQRMEIVLRAVYKPDGLNFGMNIGHAAGAGIAAHLHLHALPRWTGDTNFMSVLVETRILPETLDITVQRLREAMQSA